MWGKRQVFGLNFLGLQEGTLITFSVMVNHTSQFPRKLGFVDKKEVENEVFELESEEKRTSSLVSSSFLKGR